MIASRRCQHEVVIRNGITWCRICRRPVPDSREWLLSVPPPPVGFTLPAQARPVGRIVR
jgi:hypothetical protein